MNQSLKEALLTLLGLALAAALLCQGCCEVTIQGHPVNAKEAQQKPKSPKASVSKTISGP